MSESTIWWLLAGAAVAAELVTGTFYLLMLTVGLVAGAIAAYQNPAQLGQRIQQDYTRWGQLIRDKGIAVE